MSEEEVGCIYAWPTSSMHGWGIRGLGYSLNWPGVALAASPELTAQLPPDDPRWPLLRRRIEQSQNLWMNSIVPSGGDTLFSDVSVLVPLGNDLTAQMRVRGKRTIACPVFEDVAVVEKNVDKLKGYDAVVCASQWNVDVLGSLGVDAVLCHEGIDPVIFNPSVKRKQSDGRFRVFSGGKPEWRKGQDLVIQAFKLFAEKHDDAVLVAAWGSPFGSLARDFEGKWEHGAPPGWHVGMPNFHAWVQRAGIKPEQFEFVEPRPNWQMAEVYGGCDVGVFPSRCEGGTNFVAMECMACGVPTIRSPWHGHADLCSERGMSCHLLGQGDDVGLIVEWLSYVYYHGFDDQNLSDHWTWERHCREMADIADG